MSSSAGQRPRFYEGQYLGAEDLDAAVEYSRQANARHNLGAHTWGIAAGLDLVERKGPGGAIEVSVLPGYAWDGFGRPIVVLAPQPLSASLFEVLRHQPADEPNGRLVDVWIRYDESPTRNPRAGFEVCKTEDQRARVQENFRFEIGSFATLSERHVAISVNGQGVDAATPLQKLDPSAPATYDESVPFQELPPAGKRARWLIPLGQVRWKPAATPNQAGEFKPRSDDDSKKSRAVRRYIGVVAAAVEAAGGMIRLRRRSDDPSLPAAVPAEDLVRVEGNLLIEGNARICGGRLELCDVNGDDYSIPLRFQRHGDPGPGARTLQVVIGLANANPANRFAVGTQKSDADPTVEEKLVVLGNGNVGIGTASPNLKLDVRGDLGRDDGAATLHLWGSRIGDTGSGILFLRSGGDVVAFDPSDKVGMGTNTPQGRLTVVGRVQPLQGQLTLFSDTADIEYDGGSDGLFKIKDNGGGRTAFLGGKVGIGTENPRVRLEVDGDIRLHAGGNLMAAAGAENLRILRGSVESNGAKLSGAGCNVVRQGVGLYLITFDQPFLAPPSASVTQVYPDFANFGAGGDTRDNAVITGLNAQQMKVKTGDNQGNPRDRDFTFLVIGPR